jgi:hypothetical protein
MLSLIQIPTEFAIKQDSILYRRLSFMSSELGQMV